MIACAKPDHPACPVCLARPTATFADLDGRSYWRCLRCLATFLDPAHLPGPAEERAHYLTHENDPADPRYRAFLARLADPLIAVLPYAMSGLDYGCGPGPALAQMMREAGHHMAIYDPFFANDADALARTYDFITCTEVAEHFHDPHGTFAKLDAMLKPGGWLAIMTTFQTDDDRFAGWHYRKDPTHVVFYRRQTMRQIAADMGWNCDYPADNVVIFGKPQQSAG